MRKSHLAFFLLCISIAMVWGAEKKLKALFVIHSDGSTEIKTFDDAKSLDNFRAKQLVEIHNETVDAWEKLGKKGPKPLKPVTKKLDDMSPADLKPDRLKEITENAQKKHEKDIKKMLDNQKERDEALIGKEGLEELKKFNWQNPPGPLRIPERKIPEKFFPMTLIDNIRMIELQPCIVKFWCAAEAAPGWDPQKPVRMVVQITAEALFRKDLATKEFLAETKNYASHVKDVEGKNNMLTWWIFHDPYRVDVIPDGKWREYTVRVEYEYLSRLNATPRQAARLVFATADPAVYYLDDVALEGDRLRMKADAIIAAYRNRAIADREQGASDDDGGGGDDDTKKGGKKKNPDEKIEFEVKGPIPVAVLRNGDFNQIFGEFFQNWKFDEREDPVVAVARMNGWRGQAKNPDAPKTKNEQGDGEHVSVAEFYAKLDASRINPDKLKMRYERHGVLAFADRTDAGETTPDGPQKPSRKKKKQPEDN